MEPTPTRPQPAHCGSYKPGHETHWIPVLRVYPETPRHPVTLESISDDGWLTFTQEGDELLLWHHDVARVERLRSGQWRRVGDTTFVTSGSSWVCCGTEPSPCPADADPLAGQNGAPVTAEDLLRLATERGGFMIRGTDLDPEPSPPDPALRLIGRPGSDVRSRHLTPARHPRR